MGLRIEDINDTSHPAFPGRRVVATRRLAAHQVIGEYTGELLTAKEKRDRYPEGAPEEKEGGYVFDNCKGGFIDAFDPRLGNVTRYINGACTGFPANTTAIPEGGKVHIRVHERTIEKGSELWLDYGTEYTFAEITPNTPALHQEPRVVEKGQVSWGSGDEGEDEGLEEGQGQNWMNIHPLPPWPQTGTTASSSTQSENTQPVGSQENQGGAEALPIPEMHRLVEPAGLQPPPPHLP